MHLYDYLKLSRKVIGRWGNEMMLKDEDAVSYIATFLMKADTKYDANIGTLEGYRSMCGRYGIKKWLSDKKNKPKTINISGYKLQDDSENDYLQNIPSTDDVVENVTFNEILRYIEALNERDKNCVKMYYFEQRTLEYISKIYGITKERVRQIIQAALISIRKEYKDVVV